MSSLLNTLMSSPNMDAKNVIFCEKRDFLQKTPSPILLGLQPSLIAANTAKTVPSESLGAYVYGFALSYELTV